MTGWICQHFYTFRKKNIIFHLWKTYVSEVHFQESNWIFTKKKTSISLYTCTSQVLVSSNTCNTAIESHLNERNLEAMQVWDYTTEDYLKELRVNSHFHPWMCRVWTISSPKDGNSSFSYWKWKSVTNSSIC